jgi:Uncharacterized conserved protein
MRKRSIIVISGIFLLLIITLLPIHKALKVTNMRDDSLVFCAFVEEGDEFILSFVHSINKRAVYEYIKIREDKLMIYKARYDAFGAGMPEYPAGTATLKMIDKSVLELDNINRTVDDITVFVGTIADHQIEIKKHKIALNAIAQPQDSLKFEVGKISYFDLWKGNF